MTPGKKKWALIAAGVASPVILCSGCLLLGFLVAPKEQPVKESDRAALVRASDVAEWAELDLDIDESSETFRKTSAILGATELEYTYEDEELMINSTLTLDDSASDAIDTFGATRMAFTLADAMERDVEKAERNDLFEWGDDSVLLELRLRGEPLGSALIARKGRRTFFVLIAGVPIGDEVSMRKLLEPRLSAFESWDP